MKISKGTCAGTMPQLSMSRTVTELATAGERAEADLGSNSRPPIFLCMARSSRPTDGESPAFSGIEGGGRFVRGLWGGFGSIVAASWPRPRARRFHARVHPWTRTGGWGDGWREGPRVRSLGKAQALSLRLANATLADSRQPCEKARDARCPQSWVRTPDRHSFAGAAKSRAGSWARGRRKVDAKDSGRRALEPPGRMRGHGAFALASHNREPKGQRPGTAARKGT